MARGAGMGRAPLVLFYFWTSLKHLRIMTQRLGPGGCMVDAGADQMNLQICFMPFLFSQP